MSLNSSDVFPMYQCTLCDKKFEQPQTLALHEKHHQYKFQCGYCSRKMKTEREFLRHEATHAESTVNTYVNKSEDTKEQVSSKVINDTERSDQNSSRPSSQHRKLPSQQSRPPSQQGIRPTEETKGTSDDVFKKAEMYDEIHRRCEELDKEIAALQSKYNLSDGDEDENHMESETNCELKQSTESKDDAYEISDSEVANTNTNDDNVVWDNENKTVPKNWKCGKTKDRKRIFKSPEGFLFETRSKALEFMINGNYPENFLSLMKNNLDEEGWIHDRSCPKQWKTRKILGLDGGKDYEYLSPVMEIIPTMQEMLTFMQSQGGFARKEIKKLEEKIVGLKPKRSHRSDENSIKTKTDSVADDVLNELKKKKEDMEKKENDEEILPTGWSKKRIGGSKVYVSPEGDIVHTIQQVISAIETNKPVTKKDESPMDIKPSVAEKRKFEELFALNKRGRLDSQKSKQLDALKSEQNSDGLTERQIKILEESFSESLYPDNKQLEKICTATNLIEKEVKKWFVKKADEQARTQLKSRSLNSPEIDSHKQEKNNPSGSVDPHLPSKLFDDLQNLSEMHISSLNEIFKGKPYPTAENFRQISARLHIDSQIVIKWFRHKRIEKKVEALNQAKNNTVDAKSESTPPVKRDKNNIITEQQEQALQATLVRTKNPTHQDYKALVYATGLSRLKIQRWFNFQK